MSDFNCYLCKKPVDTLTESWGNDTVVFHGDCEDKMKSNALYAELDRLKQRNAKLESEVNELSGIRAQFNWQSEQDAQALYERDEEIKKLEAQLNNPDMVLVRRDDLEMMLKWGLVALDQQYAYDRLKAALESKVKSDA